VPWALSSQAAAEGRDKSEREFHLVSAVDANGRTIWIADAHRGDGKRFVVRADGKLTAFVELQRAIHEFAQAWNSWLTIGETGIVFEEAKSGREEEKNHESSAYRALWK